MSEIGLKSDSTDFGLGVFARGRTSAHFHNKGTLPCLIEALNIDAIGREMTGAKSFNSQLGISSGPGDFPSFTAKRDHSTATGVMINSSGV